MPDRLAGLRLRQMRKLCGFTQKALAAVINRDAPAENVTVAVVQNLESGRTTMSARRLLALAEALHVAPVELLEDAGRAKRAGHAEDGLEIIPVRSGGF
jgi:transcriptional regulator with XRE-family HTH domain